MRKYTTTYIWTGILFPILLFSGIIYSAQSSILNFTDGISNLITPLFIYLLGILPIYFFLKYPPENQKFLIIMSWLSLFFFAAGLLVNSYLDFFLSSVNTSGGWVIYPPLSALKSNPFFESRINKLGFQNLSFLLFGLSGLGNCFNVVAQFFFLLKNKQLSFRKNFFPEGLLFVLTLSLTISLAFFIPFIGQILLEKFGYSSPSDIYINGTALTDENSQAPSEFQNQISWLILHTPEVFAILFIVSLLILLNRDSKPSKLQFTFFVMSAISFLAFLIVFFFFSHSTYLDIQVHDTYFVLSYRNLLAYAFLFTTFLSTLYRSISLNHQKINPIFGFIHISFLLTGVSVFFLFSKGLTHPRYVNFNDLEIYQTFIAEIKRFLFFVFLFFISGQLILAFNYFFNNFFRKSS